MIKRYLLSLFFTLLLLPVLGGAQETEDLVTMDFQGVEIDQIVPFISKLTGKNFVLDSKVRGKVTVVTPQGVTATEAYEIFETILSAHGYKLVESDSVSRIVADSKARTNAGGGISSGRTVPEGNEKIHSHLFQLGYQDANKLVPSIKPMLHPWGLVVAHVPSNSLIVSDTAANLRKIMQVVELLDVPEKVGSVFIYRLKHARPEQVEKLINSIFMDLNSRIPTGQTGIKVFADTDSNSVLLSTTPEWRRQVTDLIDRLDVPRTTSSGNLHLYYPKYGKADVIAKALTGLLGKLGNSSDEASKEAVNFRGDVSVVAEESVNAMVVSATTGDYERLLPIIEGLDIRRLQVHIEALVLEISAERSNEFGVEWRSANNFTDASGTTAFGGTNFGNIDSAAINPFSATTGGANLGVVRGTISFGGTTYANLGLLITALQSDSDVNVIATPSLVTLDNEQAEIVVGENVPYLTGTQSTSGGSTLQSIERKDVGLKLQVTPQIQADGTLTLAISQETSSVKNTVTTGVTGLVTNKRAIQTHVTLNNNHMVVLGGLLTEDVQETVQKVPCIGSVAMVGELFTSTERRNVKRNLMVFVRPTIINTYEDLLHITNQKYGSMSNNWNQRSGKGTELLPKLEPSGIEPLKPLLPAQ